MKNQPKQTPQSDFETKTKSGEVLDNRLAQNTSQEIKKNDNQTDYRGEIEYYDWIW